MSRAARRRTGVAWPVALVAALGAVGYLLSPYLSSILVQILLVAIAALGYNLMFGNAGQYSMGSAAFMAIGAFAAAGLAVDFNLPFPLAVTVGALASATFGVAIGVPALRLATHYLIFATLSFHFIAIYILTQLQRSASGYLLPPANVLSLRISGDQHRWVALLAVIFAIVLWVTLNVARGRAGRAWTAIREHTAGAAMMGVDVVYWRLAAFAYSGFLFGLVGGLQAFYLGNVTVEPYTLQLAITFVAVILIGGLGSVAGTLFGAVIVTTTPYLIQAVLLSGYFGESAAVSTLQFSLNGLIYGSLVVLVLLYEPGGVASAARRLVTAATHTWRPRHAGPTLVALPTAPTHMDVPADLDAYAVRVLGLTAGYGHAAPALRDVALKVPKGAIVTVLGPNGAGKSTAMRAIAGRLPGSSLRIDGGHVWVGRRDMTNADAMEVARLGVSFVPERDKVFRGLSLRDNLRLRLSSDKRERLAVIYSAFPRLKEVPSSREAALLSGGERQMLALGIAIAGRPDTLLVDEASLGLAPVAIGQLARALKELNATQSVSMLIAEQNVQMALAISDYIYVLVNGLIVDSGPVDEWTPSRLRDAYLGSPPAVAATGRT